MTMIKKSITITDHQNNWIKSRVATGHYGNESEVIRELIRERQLQLEESSAQIAYIRAKLGEAENAGFTDDSVDQIWEEARKQFKS
ncbi:MAG: type II toxin-antitoxin system ParD family antitoxin [Cohaesibacteraceae bacterium]|nr:type II toxin-antitoxin system ParD family antitoxin [Cohaesibacteraceae bacterium]